MNLQQIAAAEQELRGKLNRHVAAKAVAEKEATMHSTEIADALAKLAELKTYAALALDACASIAVQPPAEPAPTDRHPDGYYPEPIQASNAA